MSKEIDVDNLHAALVKLGFFKQREEEHKMSKDTKREITSLNTKYDALLMNKASKTELRWLFGIQVSCLVVAFGWMGAQVNSINAQTKATNDTVIAIEAHQSGIKEDVEEVKKDVKELNK